MMTIKTGEEKTGMPETSAKNETTGKNLTINSNRLWDTLMDMAKVGQGMGFRISAEMGRSDVDMV
ncbi:hypothetical protein RRU01S_03_01350 [Agrobacterium rubi TR3 = NBRC 13261]|uniref:Uncharacterized protein n=1 Tax=Agrobacterium rubi TR3 = NBRC 13261 TaxID=1368415 RepID=A0A081CQM1_9HYPH|nr:hypothetical protein [Agrobacterium rubi]MCL6651413.1 hypothetical protein [Agrobacterium rubi]GAK68967.1 hypothetical protein RRU01S_03_01350 [Agrobacterium rubi TR3 = NBRC 13261]